MVNGLISCLGVWKEKDWKIKIRRFDVEVYGWIYESGYECEDYCIINILESIYKGGVLNN